MPWWKWPLVPIAGLLALPLLIAWAILILLPCELMWIGCTLLGEEERGDRFMAWSTKWMG